MSIRRNLCSSQEGNENSHRRVPAFCQKAAKVHIIKKYLSLLLIVCAFASSALARSGPPNIIVILADDLGYGDVSFNGCPDYSTPNIDSLATNGVLCTNGYVTHPFCSPSRAGLLTGRYQSAHGLAAVSESTIAPNGIHARKSARFKFASSRQRVAGHEIDGFGMRQAGTAREE